MSRLMLALGHQCHLDCAIMLHMQHASSETCCLTNQYHQCLPICNLCHHGGSDWSGLSTILNCSAFLVRSRASMHKIPDAQNPRSAHARVRRNGAGAHGVTSGQQASNTAMSQSMLPQHLRRVALQQQAGVRFDDVDFAKHNRTRFVGLENDIANCYANSLLQVSDIQSMVHVSLHRALSECSQGHAGMIASSITPDMLTALPDKP